MGSFRFWFSLVLCSFCVACNAKYIVPEARVEPLSPKGLRVSIPDKEGITLMAFHGNINVPFEGLEAGEMARDVIKKRGNRWVFEDKNIRLKKGDVIHYWLYVIYDGLGYHGLDRYYFVNDLIKPEEIYSIPKKRSIEECIPSVTTVNGTRTCSGKLLFEANFNTDKIDTQIWKQEKKIGGLDGESVFVIFDADNSKIVGNKLKITPTLTEEEYTADFVRHGVLDVEGCTSVFEEFCEARGVMYLGVIIPPVMCARLTTLNGFKFQHGIVEIKAKLPQGDWIVPELRLEADQDDAVSDQIVIGLARGNKELKANGLDISSRVLTAGIILNGDDDGQTPAEKIFRKTNSIPWSENYHVYKLIWTKDQLTFLVDEEEIGKIEGKENIGLRNDQYHITLGVHVGGNVDFENVTKKPWSDHSLKARYSFWKARKDWKQSWSDNSALNVEYVKVWAV